MIHKGCPPPGQSGMTDVRFHRITQDSAQLKHYKLLNPEIFRLNIWDGGWPWLTKTLQSETGDEGEPRQEGGLAAPSCSESKVTRCIAGSLGWLESTCGKLQTKYYLPEKKVDRKQNRESCVKIRHHLFRFKNMKNDIVFCIRISIYERQIWRHVITKICKKVDSLWLGNE